MFRILVFRILSILLCGAGGVRVTGERGGGRVVSCVVSQCRIRMPTVLSAEACRRSRSSQAESSVDRKGSTASWRYGDMRHCAFVSAHTRCPSQLSCAHWHGVHWGLGCVRYSCWRLRCVRICICNVHRYVQVFFCYTYTFVSKISSQLKSYKCIYHIYEGFHNP